MHMIGVLGLLDRMSALGMSCTRLGHDPSFRWWGRDGISIVKFVGVEWWLRLVGFMFLSHLF